MGMYSCLEKYGLDPSRLDTYTEKEIVAAMMLCMDEISVLQDRIDHLSCNKKNYHKAALNIEKSKLQDLLLEKKLIARLYRSLYSE